MEKLKGAFMFLSMYLLEMTANLQAYYSNGQGYSVELRKGKNFLTQEQRLCLTKMLINMQNIKPHICPSRNNVLMEIKNKILVYQNTAYKIHQEHVIHIKISIIYCRKMNDPSLFHCANTKLSLFLGSTFNYEKE